MTKYDRQIWLARIGSAVFCVAVIWFFWWLAEQEVKYDRKLKAASATPITQAIEVEGVRCVSVFVHKQATLSCDWPSK